MGKKVIVIDDSRTARQQVTNVLIEAGYDVVEAVDGKDGVDKVKTNPDANLVICDMNMPRMSGLDVLKAVKGGGQNATLAFLMLTTETQPELVQQAKQGGAKGWIIKPFKPELLLAAVNKLVG